jgi:hypothetical protein
MTPHRLFKLNYGFPVADFFVGLVVASVSFETYKIFLDERIAMPLCALTGTAALLTWLWLKQLLPRHFVPDVVDWLLQPAVYRVTRDDLTPPLMIWLEKETHERT